MGNKRRLTRKILFSKTIEVLQPIMNLDKWALNVRFSKKMKDTADCEAWPEYKEAIIRIHDSTIKDLSHYEIISCAVHELIHCVVWPLGHWAEKLSKSDDNKLNLSTQFEETVVTDLEQILVPLLIPILQQKLFDDGYSTVEFSAGS